MGALFYVIFSPPSPKTNALGIVDTHGCRSSEDGAPGPANCVSTPSDATALFQRSRASYFQFSVS